MVAFPYKIESESQSKTIFCMYSIHILVFFWTETSGQGKKIWVHWTWLSKYNDPIGSHLPWPSSQVLVRYWSPYGGQKIHLIFFTDEAISLPIKWGSTKNIYLPNTFFVRNRDLRPCVKNCIWPYIVLSWVTLSAKFMNQQILSPEGLIWQIPVMLTYFLCPRPNLLGISPSDELHLFQCVMLLICMVFQFYCQKVFILIHFYVHIVCRVSTILNCNNISYNLNYNSTWGHLHDI